MSTASRRISLARTERGRWIATDEATGTTGEGDSAGVALLGLGLKLGLLEDEAGSLDELIDSLVAELDEEPASDRPTARLESLAARIRDRFAARGVTDDDVEDAIRWARSP